MLWTIHRKREAKKTSLEHYTHTLLNRLIPNFVGFENPVRTV